MKSQTYPVFVDPDTASALGITEHEGRPPSAAKREGVYVGETDPVTTYTVDDWDAIPAEVKTKIITDANRQIVQDAKNITRADVKNGGSLSLTKQRDNLMLTPPDVSDPIATATWAKEMARLGKEIADAKAAKAAK